MRILRKVPTYEQVKSDNPGIKALIFDMDGTFFDTETLHAITHHKLIEVLTGEKPTLSVMEIDHKYRGLADGLVHREFIADTLIPKDIDLQTFMAEKNKILFVEVSLLKLEEIFDYGILSLINEAREDGLKIALCTASERDITHHLLHEFDFFDFFDLVITDEDHVESKPSPEPYLGTIKKLQLNFKDVVIFEDSVFGVQAAVASGAPMYKVEWYLD